MGARFGETRHIERFVSQGQMIRGGRRIVKYFRYPKLFRHSAFVIRIFCVHPCDTTGTIHAPVDSPAVSG